MNRHIIIHTLLDELIITCSSVRPMVISRFDVIYFLLKIGRKIQYFDDANV